MKRIVQGTLILYGLLIAPLAICEKEVLDYIVAVINDQVIVNSELQQEVSVALRQWQEKHSQMPPLQDVEKQVLERLIMISLQLQLAERKGIKVEDTRLNERLRQIATRNKMDLPTFREQLEKEGFQFLKVREKLREQMIIERLQQRQVVSRINISAQEIDNFLASQSQQGQSDQEYHIWHILIATPEAPSPEEIETKAEKAKQVLTKLQNGADFQATAVAVSDSRQALEGGDLGWLKAGEMPTLFNGVVNQMAIGEIEGPIRDTSGFHIIKLVDKRGEKKNLITQTKVRHILIKTSELVSDFEAQLRLEQLQSRLEQGDDFIQLARANSEDTSTAAKGGLIGWVNPGDLAPEFEEVMNRLSENQMSEPFKSRYGWHLVQVLERRQHDNTAQALRTQAARQIHQRKIEEELQAWLRQLRDEAYVECRLEYLKTDCSTKSSTS